MPLRNHHRRHHHHHVHHDYIHCKILLTRHDYITDLQIAEPTNETSHFLLKFSTIPIAPQLSSSSSSVNDGVTTSSSPTPSSSPSPPSSSSPACKAHLELVPLDDLIQVGTEEFERDANVVPEGEVVEHLDDVVLPFLVLFPQVLQDPDLLLGLRKWKAMLNDSQEWFN